MERTGHRDIRSLQKYQRPDTSTRIEFSKAFDSGESLPLSESLGSVKSPLKREVEQDNEFVCKFAKGYDKDGNPDAKPVNFNNCTFVISKDFKLN